MAGLAGHLVGLQAQESLPPYLSLHARLLTLRAFGPASAADMTAWSGTTRLGPVLAAREDLVRHQDEDGRVLYDVPDGVLVGEDAPAPVRLLGCYDNVWLSQARRDRVTEPEKRAAWTGVNGGTALLAR